MRRESPRFEALAWAVWLDRLKHWGLVLLLVVVCLLATARWGRAAGVLDEGACAARLVYWESRDRTVAAQVEVARVVYERARQLDRSPCWLLHHPGWNGEAFRKLASEGPVREPAALERAQEVVLYALTHAPTDECGRSATHFHDETVSPGWSDLRELCVVDHLHFYGRR